MTTDPTPAAAEARATKATENSMNPSTKILTATEQEREAFLATPLGALFVVYANTAANANYRDAMADGEMTDEVKAAWAAASAARNALIDGMRTIAFPPKESV